jgi:hypothetical protein
MRTEEKENERRKKIEKRRTESWFDVLCSVCRQRLGRRKQEAGAVERRGGQRGCKKRDG